ncbi:MAG: molybdenum cofactor biosynthesis protein MoaE, partial [Candidatus Dormibacteraceae bacterium]
MLCRITDQPLENCRAEIERSLLHSAAGALCTFTGVVREYGDLRDVTHLEYEAYSEMATLRMAAISDQIEARWPGSRVAMIHRVGRLAVGEAAVLVSVSTPHRAEA